MVMEGLLDWGMSEMRSAKDEVGHVYGRLTVGRGLFARELSVGDEG